MRSIALAIATLVLVSGCTDDPEPIEPKPSASATPVPAPKMHDLAREDTADGAATFVAYWVATFNYAAQTGEVQQMIEHARDCSPCLDYAAEFRSLKPSERARKAVWKLSIVSISADRDPIKVAATVDVAGEDSPGQMTFVLNDQPPYELRDIYLRSS